MTIMVVEFDKTNDDNGSGIWSLIKQNIGKPWAVESCLQFFSLIFQPLSLCFLSVLFSLTFGLSELFTKLATYMPLKRALKWYNVLWRIAKFTVRYTFAVTCASQNAKI